MKLLRFGKLNHEKPAVIDSNNKIRDISSVIDDISPLNISNNIIKKIKSLNLKDFPVVSNSERIGACICNPGKFIGIGMNYIDHAKEAGVKIPNEPIVFLKANSSVSGPNDDVIIPKNSIKTDWEIELGIVIEKKAKYISKNNAQNYILGYCLVNDVSEREYQIERSSGQWDKGKGCDTFGPIGPYIVTKDEIDDVKNLNLELKVNGTIMQKGNTKSMIFDVNYIVHYLSNFMTLNPGDIICTGTPPGVGMGKKPQVFLKEGDEMELQIDYLGKQKQKLIC